MSDRPPRVELFAFYYLGFNPEGKYRFPNVRHVAAFYGVGHDAVQEWLDALELSPRDVLKRDFDLAGAQVDLQMEAGNLTPEGIQARAAEILKDMERRGSNREAWRD